MVASTLNVHRQYSAYYWKEMTCVFCSSIGTGILILKLKIKQKELNIMIIGLLLEIKKKSYHDF